MRKPLCIDLYCGSFGWSAGFVAEGWRSVGFDIAHEPYHGPIPEHCELVLQDVLTLHGSQFRNADCIVASPPCQRYSWMAQPWSLAKREARWQRWERDSQFGDYHLNDLFDACFRIQREACEAAGRHIPMVVENVKGAQPWVGSAKANFGSFYFWGDVAMVGEHVVAGSVPRFGQTVKAARRRGGKVDGFNFHQFENTGQPGGSFQGAAVKTGGLKNARNWWSDGEGNLSATTSSHSAARKAASAQIAKIPFPLASYIARALKPY